MKKGMKVNTIAWIAAAAVLAAAVPINMIFSKVDVSVDVTPFNAYSLSDSAVNVLSELAKPVDMYVLYDLDRLYDDSEPGEAEYMMADMYVSTLRQMDEFDKINLHEVNIEKNPGFVAEKDPEGIMNLSSGDILLECDGKKRDISLKALFTTNAETGSVEFYGENSILGAINYLESGITPTVYFTEGHGEKGMDKCASLISIIKSQNYDVKSLNIEMSGTIPSDATTVVVAGPSKDLSDTEKNIILDYAAAGGNITMLLPPQEEKVAFRNIEAVLASYEIGMDYNRVYETKGERYAGDDRFAVMCEFVDTDFNKAIIEAQSGSSLYMPDSRSFYSTSPKDSDKENPIKQETLISTFDSAVSDVCGGIRTDAEGPGGVLYLAANAEDSSRNGSKLFVSGSYDFINDESIIEIMQETNNASLAPYLLLSTISWMDKVNAESQFPTRVQATDYITIPDKKTGNIILVIMVLFPILIAGSGVFVWARRHNA